MSQLILPEGRYSETQENQRLCSSIEGLQEAFAQELVIEGMALYCEEGVGITVALGNFTGFIPWFEGASGLEQGLIREIAVMSRVGRPVAVVITDIREQDGIPYIELSRRLAQDLARDHILTKPKGSILPATVTRLETFGAFVDVGCGVASLISIDRISISRINHPSQRFHVGQEIYVAILEHDWANDRIRVTHRELLGTWCENARQYSIGMTVPGIVRSIKPYGLFVELAPNFSGLAESVEGIAENQRVSVYIKGIISNRMKCKLLLIGCLPPTTPSPFHYFLPDTGRLTAWNYAVEGCSKIGGETLF